MRRRPSSAPSIHRPVLLLGSLIAFALAWEVRGEETAMEYVFAAPVVSVSP